MKARIAGGVFCGLAAVMLLACSAGGPAASTPLRIERLDLQAAADFSSEPQLIANGGRAVLSWVENRDDGATLKFAERTPSGWSEPRAAASGQNWFLSWADVPSVMPLAEGTLVAQWLQTTVAAAEAYDIRLAFSHDNGRTWSAPVTPHHDNTKTQHGFASLFQMPHGDLGLIWLDGRAEELDATKGNDDMSLRAALFNRDGTQASETLVDDRACDCCPTSVAVTADGPIAAFRDRSATEVRDISVSRLVNGAWTPSTTVHADGWTITACPVNGPAIAARDRDVAVAWFTAKDDRGHAFAAFSRNGGATFGSPIRLDEEGSLGRVAVAMLDEGAAAMWTEFANGRSELKVRRLDTAGRRGPAQTIAGMSRDRASGYPRMARLGHELLFAWTESHDGKSTVKTAFASLK